MDDANIPEETFIYFSKWKISIGFAIGTLLLFLGLYLGIGKSEYVSSGIFIAFAIYLTISSYKRFSNHSAQITINKLGIKTAVVDFYTWEEVGNECVTREQKDKSEIICLEYDCPNGHEEFNINDLDISGDDLAYILSVYRERSGKKYKYDKPIAFSKST